MNRLLSSLTIAIVTTMTLASVSAAPPAATATPPAEVLQQYRVMETHLQLLDPRGVLQVISDKEHESLEDCWASTQAANLDSKKSGAGSVFVCWPYPE